MNWNDTIRIALLVAFTIVATYILSKVITWAVLTTIDRYKNKKP